MPVNNKKIIYLFIIGAVICLAGVVCFVIKCNIAEARVLKQVGARLEASSRLAEVLVTDVNYDEQAQRLRTTIKFLEYDIDGEPLSPRYFSFSGNTIQFQSIAIKLDGLKIKKDAQLLKGKQAYVFWKVFMLDAGDTREYKITTVNSVPEAYRIKGAGNGFEARLWRLFWNHALDPDKADNISVSNTQIQADGAMFIPAAVYPLEIGRDGKISVGSTRTAKIAK